MADDPDGISGLETVEIKVPVGSWVPRSVVEYEEILSTRPYDRRERVLLKAAQALSQYRYSAWTIGKVDGGISRNVFGHQAPWTEHRVRFQSPITDWSWRAQHWEATVRVEEDPNFGLRVSSSQDAAAVVLLATGESYRFVGDTARSLLSDLFRRAAMQWLTAAMLREGSIPDSFSLSGSLPLEVWLPQALAARHRLEIPEGRDEASHFEAERDAELKSHLGLMAEFDGGGTRKWYGECGYVLCRVAADRWIAAVPKFTSLGWTHRFELVNGWFAAAPYFMADEADDEAILDRLRKYAEAAKIHVPGVDPNRDFWLD